MPEVLSPDITGSREDLSDMIWLVDPQDTPMTSALPKKPPAKAPVHQYQGDLPARVSKRGVRDGTPAAAAQSMSKDRALIETIPMWVTDVVGVGKKATKLNNVAGVKDIYANEVAKGMQGRKVAIDEITCDDYDQRDEGPEGGETRGLGVWIQATAQGVRPVPAAYLPKAAQIYNDTFENITELKVQQLINAAYLQGGAMRYFGVCGIDLKQVISNFSIYQPNSLGNTPIRSYRGDIEGAVLAAAVDIITCDGGTIELHVSRNLAVDRALAPGLPNPQTAATRHRGYILPLEHFGLGFEQEILHTELPFDGGGRNGIIDAIFHTEGLPQMAAKIAPSD